MQETKPSRLGIPARANVLPPALPGQSRLSEFGSVAKSARTTNGSGLADVLHSIETAAIMNSLRIARAALRVRPATLRTPVQRRGYAEAVADKVCFSSRFALRTASAKPALQTDQAQLVPPSPGTAPRNAMLVPDGGTAMIRRR